jgi:phage tail-like protein
MATPIINPFSNLTTDPIRNFRFLVQFTPLGQDVAQNQTGSSPTFNPSIGFTNITGFGISVDPIAYREGGYNTTMHYFPGQASFEPINFTRGTTIGSKQNHQWMKELFAVIQGRSTAGVASDFRYNIDVAVISHPNTAGTKQRVQGAITDGDRASSPWDLHMSMRFRIYNAWISRLVYGDLGAGGNGIMVEGLTVVHEGFDVSYADGYTATAPTFDI